MGLHRNARLGLAGRRALVADVEAGCSCREAARRRGVSPTTACKWWRRWSEATLEQRRSLACLEDRSSRPHRMPAAVVARRAGADLRGQAPLGLGAAVDRRRDRPSARDGLADAKRAGISRPPRQPREQPRLYEWPCPGDLLHIDSKRFVRFTRPGHAVTGDRHCTGAEKRMRVGYEWVHSLVDDHSRYAYSELHRDERAATVTGFVERGLAHFAEHGIEAEAAALRQRLRLPPQPLAARAARRATGSSTASSGRADPRPTARSSATSKPSNANGDSARPTAPSDHRAQALSHWLQLLQPAQTTQLTRRPATDQPRPQPPEAGHLEA